MNLVEQEQLKVEIQHIFDSGANEVRIFEMVKSFIEHYNVTSGLPIQDVSFSLLEQITANAITGIMANPNAMPTTTQNFHDIAEDAVRIAKETVRQLNNES
tara:strand:+ start:241 stop:543 length:303 start_codon:yes stop_codon:yes gene_type:complete